MKYDNTYELIEALAKIDPELSVAVRSWDWAQGMDIGVTTSAVSSEPIHREHLREAVLNAIANNLIGFCPPGTTNFSMDLPSFNRQ